jgi:hypothetical protein
MTQITFELQRACATCGSLDGILTFGDTHQRLDCANCGRWQKWVSKQELGLAPRPVARDAQCVPPKQRARILARDGCRCQFCGSTERLHVGHILAHAEGTSAGIDHELLDSDDNLITQCEACNVPVRESLPLWLAAALLARKRPHGAA